MFPFNRSILDNQSGGAHSWISLDWLKGQNGMDSTGNLRGWDWQNQNEGVQDGSLFQLQPVCPFQGLAFVRALTSDFPFPAAAQGSLSWQVQFFIPSRGKNRDCQITSFFLFLQRMNLIFDSFIILKVWAESLSLIP